MEHAVEANVVKSLLVISGGQAGVARAEARTKRMGRRVDPAGGEVESDASATSRLKAICAAAG